MVSEVWILRDRATGEELAVFPNVAVQVYEGDGFDVIIKIRLPDIGPEGVKPKEALAALLTLFTAYDANTARTFIQFLLTQIWMSARRLSVPPVIPLDSVTAPLTP